MVKQIKRIAVTGGAGQIAYSLLFRLAAGEVFGKEQPIALHILELPEALPALEGVRMELEDCAYPLLKEIHTGSDPYKLFEGVHYALLIGAKPRTLGMERKELLKENAKIFIEQGKALDKVASKDATVLVVGNPCNTNCLIAMENAPRLSKNKFYAMTMLDQNRACAQLAKKSGVEVSSVTRMTIWGNHSSTQVPDFFNARINGKPVEEVIRDSKWLQTDFIKNVQERGAAVIAARGKSSAASAANAVIDTLIALITPTEPEKWFSAGCLSDGNPYGVEKGLIFSFPCRVRSDGVLEIVPDLRWNPFMKEKIKVTEDELIKERDLKGGT